MALMGIDIGSTNVKCVIVDSQGKVLGLSKMRSPTGILDIQNLQTCVSALCRDALASAGPCKIEGMAVASVGCGAIYLDKNLMQLKIEDPGYIDPLQGISEREYMNISGYPKHYSSGGMVLARAMHAGTTCDICHFLSVVDYINFYLTGVMKRELSTASSMQLLDKQSGGDWQEFFEAYKIDAKVLPEICKSGEYIGKLTAKDCGLPVGTPVFAGGHDYLCAAYAAGCYKQGDIINVLGTYEMTAAFFEAPQKNFDEANILSFMDHHTFPGRYTITAEHLGPGNNPKPQAISEANQKSATAISYLQSKISNKNTRIKVVGGGTNSPFWLQDKANTLNQDLIIPKIKEATATGAALLAGYGCKIYQSHKEATQVYEGKEEIIKSKDEIKR